MNHSVIQGDCLDVLPTLGKFRCIFADPPDNIGLKYGGYVDRLPAHVYRQLLGSWVNAFVKHADIVWLSFNPLYVLDVAESVRSYLPHDWEFKDCVQVFTFGQYNPNDLGTNHRPLWRLKHRDAPLYPEAIKVPSWRELHGDKRAHPGGRVPGDVFDFPRVTGNSKQRRKWHPTQLHEALVERCVLFSTEEGDRVGDPFGGTGTTLRVCQRINRPCTLIEVDPSYCQKIAAENNVPHLIPREKAA